MILDIGKVDIAMAERQMRNSDLARAMKLSAPRTAALRMQIKHGRSLQPYVAGRLAAAMGKAVKELLADSEDAR